MTRGKRAITRRACWLAGVLALLSFVTAPAGARAQFSLGLQYQAIGQPGTAPTASNTFGAMRSMAASTVRISLFWSQVAPSGSTRPSGFNQSDPADPDYDWTAVDAAVRAAAQNHKQVLLDLYSPPQWAQGAHRPASSEILDYAWDPSPVEFKAFARAAAERYDGSFADPLHPGAHLPRVRQWEIWNEENLPWYLAAPHLIDEYRDLLNAGYSAITGVHSDNTIVMGGLAPVSFLPPRSVSPLKFAAELMCLRRVGVQFVRARGCTQRAQFDVFAHHPYSLAATPTKHAYRYDDVLVADMQKIANLVHAADRLHTVLPNIRHKLWVTEFGWYTNPPNTVVGDSQTTAARYVDYSMYEMWRAGVSLVIWYTLEDYPAKYNNGTTVTPGAGLETARGKPKLMMQAFGFPVIAAVSGGHGLVWGRAPETRRVGVVIQRLSHHRWVRVTTVRTGSDGVFQATFAAGSNATYRAAVDGGPVSLGYDSRAIPPQRTHLFSTG
jgi:hypothetical protein